MAVCLLLGVAAAAEGEPLCQTGKILVPDKGGAGVRVTDFVSTFNAPVKAPTAAVVRWDHDALTVAFECADENVVAKSRRHDDADIWRDDCVEVFLDVGHTHKADGRWFHVIVSAAGALLDEHVGVLAHDIKGLKANVERTPAGWNAEIVIPWAGLDVRPEPGDVWGLNLNREDYDAPGQEASEYTCWSPTYGGFHNVNQWGHVVFAGPKGKTDMNAVSRKLKETHAMVKPTKGVPVWLPAPMVDMKLRQLGYIGDTVTWDEGTVLKRSSTFFSKARIENARENVRTHAWAAKLAKGVLAGADRWVRMSDDELWAVPYGPELCRSIFVSKKLGCPNCGMKIYEGRPSVYAWEFDPEKHPWKMRCPACGELFPKNDFAAFYKSGIGPDGLFHYGAADRSLLFNADRPDPDDPKHTYGVDDGRGWADVMQHPDGRPTYDIRHWWIGYYAMCYWLRRIVPAIDSLSQAYALTGETRYAHKCAVLLDRVADIYPTYHGDTQHYNNGWKRFAGSYIGASYFDLAFLTTASMAYDRIFSGIAGDKALVAFLSAKAGKHGMENPKKTVSDVRRNIERRLIIEIILHPGRGLSSNGSRDACIYAMAKMILSGRSAKQSLLEHDMPLVADPRHFHPDGSSGERAVGYDFGHITGAGANFLSHLYDYDKAFARQALEAYPNFRRAFYFMVNLRCLGRFVPQIGDAGAAGRPWNTYYHEAHAKLYDLTRDPMLAQYIHLCHRGKLDGVHAGIFSKNAAAVQKRIADDVEQHGPLAPGFVHYPDYRLAIFRSGRGAGRRAMWIKYTAEGGTSSHAHSDGMNLGIFAKGLDLVPDHGYPEFTGGWPARHEWTAHTRSHVTVLVDGERQRGARATVKALSPGEGFQFFQADGPAMYPTTKRYERTCALVDVNAGDCYVVDVFRVDGGKEHVYDFHGAEGPVASDVLATRGERTEFPGGDYKDLWTKERYPPDAPRRYYLHDGGVTARPGPGWWLDWQVKDTFDVRRAKGQVHLRLMHLSAADEVVVAVGEPAPQKDGIRSMHYLLARREAKGKAPLSSTFVSVIEPYEDERVLGPTRREPFGREGAEDVALSVDLTGGQRDIIVLPDAAKRGKVRGQASGVNVSLQGSALWVRLRGKAPAQAVLVDGRSLEIGDVEVTLPKRTDRLALRWSARGTTLTLAGRDADVAKVTAPDGTDVRRTTQ